MLNRSSGIQRKTVQNFLAISEINAIRDHLKSNLANYLSHLEEWVGINSYTLNPPGVDKLGKATAKVFDKLGFESSFVRSNNLRHGSHLLLEKGNEKTSTVTLVSHLDTVFQHEEEVQNNFRYEVSGDRIYGPGVGDIKGGTLMIYMILHTLKCLGLNEYNNINWLLGFNAAEEVGGNEFSSLLESRSSTGSIATLVFEPGSLRDSVWPLVVARKGRFQCEIKIEGRGAHAGVDFWSGRNAILLACNVAKEIAKLSCREDSLTVNIGFIEGGSVPNRVPHLAKLVGEARAFQTQSLSQTKESIKEIVQRECGEASELSFTIESEPWPPNKETNEIFKYWSQAAATLNRRVTTQERGGISDGNLLWSTSPTLDGLGPIGANFHCSEKEPENGKDQEFIVLSMLLPKALLNIVALINLIRNKSAV